MQKESVVPTTHAIHQGFTPVEKPTKKVLNLAALRGVADKQNYNTTKFVELAAARAVVKSFCEKHKGEDRVEVNIIAYLEDSKQEICVYQFYVEGENEIVILAAKFFSSVKAQVGDFEHA